MVRTADRRSEVQWFTKPDEWWGAAEAALLSAGVPLTLQHRLVWVRAGLTKEAWLACIGPGSEGVGFGFGVEVHSTRAIPGYRVARIRRFGNGVTPGNCSAALTCAAARAQSEPGILRLHIEVCSPDPVIRATIARAAACLGYRRVPPRMYTHTILLDLRQDESALLGSFSKTARQNIRAVAKHPVSVRVIDDPRWAPRIDALEHEAFARTGGSYDSSDWGRLIKFAQQHPDLMRVVGLFRTEGEHDCGLLAFATAYRHGDVVEYASSGSTRVPDLRIPLSYALIWDLICWARSTGAAVFDLGGVDVDSASPKEIARKGIGEFKRYFSDTIVEVGEEWIFEPSPVAATLARLAGALRRATAMVVGPARGSSPRQE